MSGFTADAIANFGRANPSYVNGTLVPPAPAPVAAPAAPVTASGLAYGPSPTGPAPALYAPAVGAATGASASTPPPGGIGGMAAGLGLFTPGEGLNWNALSMIGQGVGGLAGLWNAFQQTKLARETLDMNREAFNENLDNSIQSYNTNLEGSTRAEYSQEGRSQKAASRYINRNKLARGD